MSNRRKTIRALFQLAFLAVGAGLLAGAGIIGFVLGLYLVWTTQ